MNIKCPNCMASLVFDVQTGKMQCKFCDTYFSMDEIDYDTVQCNIYTCTSCGAELAINGVESSTFCAYCGQPTIVFDRVSQTLKPEVIIPFKIQKQQAVEAIRARFRQGFFIPREVKDFEVDRVHGIYIPYWLYDAYYYDKQLITGMVGNGNHSRTRYFMREADCQFYNVSVDASKNLNNDFSQRLEPYDMSELKEFEIGYMSGYYADCYDISGKEIREVATQRIREMFDEQVMATCNAKSKSVVCSDPKIDIQKETYALFPAWFMTFRYKDTPYTMLVNGQTGKVVGAVPCDNIKVKLVGVAIFLLTLLISIPLGIGFCSWASADGENFLERIITLIVMMVVMLSLGDKYAKKMQKSKKLSASQSIKEYAHKRQSAGGEFK